MLLKKGLKEIQNILKAIPNINHGGCGISALAIYRWLIKNNVDRKDISIVYMDYRDDTHEENKNNYSRRDFSLDSPCHCCLLYKGKYFDCDGLIKVDKYEHYFKFKTQARLLRSINNSMWNSMFNRKINVPKIQSLLNIDLSDVKIKRIW